MTERTPVASTATGFSQNTCLPALIAASRCRGRNPGGVVSSTTSTSDASTFLYPSKPSYRRSLGTSTLPAMLLMPLRLV